MSPWLLQREDELDRFVADFEAAHQRDGQAEINDFLPDRSHPLYLTILSELVRVDLEFRWTRGQPRALEEYERQFPELFDDPQLHDEIRFEQRRLREQAEQKLRGSTSSESQRGAPDWPKLGSTFAGFPLVSELGRGSFSRVYLAMQPGLSDRLVALKVSSEAPAESGLLARLQHANIVPVYSVHREGRLHGICMPFFGATTLADVLHDFRGKPAVPPSGNAFEQTVRASRTALPLCHSIRIVDALRESVRREIGSSPTALGESSERFAPQPSIAGETTDAPCWQTLSEMSYVDAVLWIGARLASGLQHAHERGIVHRDLKPANVLLADDGQPMLLDFNLSEDVGRGEGPSDGLGGTLPYMAPETLLAFQRRQRGGDARSDLYSLGVVLFELLAGQPPFPLRNGELESVLTQMLADRTGPVPRFAGPRLGLTPAVESIVRRCLEPEPRRRYQSAAELREDLERHAQHLPVKHASEPSWRERSRKWARRHPRVTSASTIGLVALILVAGLAVQLVGRGQRLRRIEATRSLELFQQELQTAQVAALDAPTAGAQRLETILSSCQQALDRCEALLAQSPSLTSLQRGQLQYQASELCFLLAAVTRLQSDAESGERALAWNDRALRFAGAAPPIAYRLQRAAVLESLGRAGDELSAVRDSSGAMSSDATNSNDGVTARSTRDASLLACWFTAQRRYKAALPHWQRAVHDEPHNVWAWFGLGACYELIERPSQAAAAFSACIALAPREHAWYFHRGLAWLRQNEYSLAASDFESALGSRPGHAESRINRALAWLGEGRCQLVIDDLAGWSDRQDRSRVLLLVAEAYRRLDRKEDAERFRAEALACEPHDEAAWIARGVARVDSDPHAALADFECALAANHHSLAALESKAHVLSERLGDSERAIAALTFAMEQHPEVADVQAARGVLLARCGRLDEARRNAERALQVDASPAVEFRAAGVFALASRESPSDARRAFELLTSALRRGFGRELISSDPDLAPLHGDPRFERLVQALAALGFDAVPEEEKLGACNP